MAKEKYERTKPHVNIGTIGHVDHGKTTLTAAISKVLHEEFPDVNPEYDFNQIDSAPEEAARGITINIAHIEYQTEKRHYAHVTARPRRLREEHDHRCCPDGWRYSRCGRHRRPDGPDSRARAARPSGWRSEDPRRLNKCDMVDDEELIELVEEEVRDLLDENGFDRDCPVIHTSAYGALHDDAPDHEKWVQSVKDLMDAVDDYIPTPVHDLDKPFLMPIEDVFTISGRGTVVTGRVERGQLAVNTPVEIVGIRATQQTTVTSIETFHKTMDACEAGDNTGLLLRGLGRDDVERGQVVAKPGSVTPHTKFEGEVYVLTKDEGGRHSPFFSNYRPQFYFRTTDVTGVITLPEGVEMVQPGDHATFGVELIQPIAMEEGLTFAVREGGHTVGSGRVTKIIE